VVNVPTRPAGRPGSAILILGAIFATAVLFRMPLGRAAHEVPVANLDAHALAAWSALPTASMAPPAITVDPIQPRAVRVEEPASPETARVASVTIHDEPARPDVATNSVANSASSPVIVSKPMLLSTPQSHLAILAAPVTPASLAEPSSSSPFGAVGTAFAKTGAALTLAFKKTGQGILAPF
jgi:hypothetical protein